MFERTREFAENVKIQLWFRVDGGYRYYVMYRKRSFEYKRRRIFKRRVDRAINVHSCTISLQYNLFAADGVHYIVLRRCLK